MLKDLLRGKPRDITPKNRLGCFNGLGGNGEGGNGGGEVIRVVGAVTYDIGGVPGSGVALFHHGADHTEANIVPWEEVEEAFYNGVIRLNSDGKVGTMVSFYVYGSSRGISYSLGNESTLKASGDTVYKV